MLMTLVLAAPTSATDGAGGSAASDDSFNAATACTDLTDASGHQLNLLPGSSVDVGLSAGVCIWLLSHAQGGHALLGADAHGNRNERGLNLLSGALFSRVPQREAVVWLYDLNAAKQRWNQGADPSLPADNLARPRGKRTGWEHRKHACARGAAYCSIPHDCMGTFNADGRFSITRKPECKGLYGLGEVRQGLRRGHVLALRAGTPQLLRGLGATPACPMELSDDEVRQLQVHFASTGQMVSTYYLRVEEVDEHALCLPASAVMPGGAEGWVGVAIDAPPKACATGGAEAAGEHVDVSEGEVVHGTTDPQQDLDKNEPAQHEGDVESESDDTFEATEESESDSGKDDSDDPGASPRSPRQVLTRLNTLHLVCPRALVPSVRPLQNGRQKSSRPTRSRPVPVISRVSATCSARTSRLHVAISMRRQQRSKASFRVTVDCGGCTGWHGRPSLPLRKSQKRRKIGCISRRLTRSTWATGKRSQALEPSKE